MANLKQLDTQSFDLALNNSNIPVLVDFYADWCGPCRALAPTLEAVAEANQGALSVVKVDIDESPDLAGRYEIQSIPTLVVFQGGELVGRIAGLVSRSELDRQLEGLLAGSPAAN